MVDASHAGGGENYTGEYYLPTRSDKSHDIKHK